VKLVLTLVLVAGMLSCLVAWASTSRVFELNIATPVSGGRVVNEVTPIGETFSLVVGKGSTISGLELYRIDLSSGLYTNLLRIHLALVNANEIGKVLSNPNAFVSVGVYHPGTGEGQVTLHSNGVRVIPDNDSRATAVMNRTAGDVLLYPGVMGQTTLYLLASVHVPSGGTPPGQQEQLRDLRFNADVRVNSLRDRVIVRPVEPDLEPLPEPIELPAG
jgi:hypothetical protein